jgi:Tol biopolymer transport system component
MFLGSGDKAAAPLLKYVSGSTLILQTASGVAYHGPAPRAAGDLIAFIKRVRAGAKP